MQQGPCQGWYKKLKSDLEGADIPVSLSITSTDGAALTRAKDRAVEGVEGSRQEGGGKTDWQQHQRWQKRQHFGKEKERGGWQLQHIGSSGQTDSGRCVNIVKGVIEV